jgi:hypothetical protein
MKNQGNIVFTSIQGSNKSMERCFLFLHVASTESNSPKTIFYQLAKLCIKTAKLLTVSNNNSFFQAIYLRTCQFNPSQLFILRL